MLTIGISGATCSGKTSVAAMLEKALPLCTVINQDKYYYDDDSPHHIIDKKTNLINWEVLEAFNMDRMHLDITTLKQKMAKENLIGLGAQTSQIKQIPLLVLEGIIIFRDPEIFRLCDLKYFIEIDRDTCQSRRQGRVWDPEESCWEENPEYFENIAWPEYINCANMMKDLKGIKFLDSSNTPIQKNFEMIMSEIVDKIKE